MKLSEINTQPIYHTEVPSTKQKIKFRPFLVRDERALLTAEQSEDPEVMIATLEQIVRNCITEKNITLSSFDLEYLFVKIRSKSVSEFSTIQVECQNCQDKLAYKLNLDLVEVTEIPDPIIKLREDLVIEMKFPAAETIIELEKKYNSNFDLAKYELAARCISTISVDDETIDTSEEKLDAVLEFIETLSHNQFELLEKFVENIPQTKINAHYTCRKCNHENKFELTGIQNFF